jgi:hypothetical protein
MKKTKSINNPLKPLKRKLILRLEHLVLLTPDQLGQVAGASGQEISCTEVCSKPG